MMDEFPHEITFLVENKISDGGGGSEKEWNPYITILGFLDTPTSEEIYQAHQLAHPFDRHLYYPYRTDIKPSMRVKHNDDTYEIVGKPLDQGGQNEIMKVSLRLING